MDQIDRVLGGIAASFEGAVAREEEIAADDLALSFRQGRSLRDALARAGELRLADGGSPALISVLGSDYVGIGHPMSSVIPLRHAVVSCRSGGTSPQQLKETWIQRARDWRGRAVVVGLATSLPTGVLDLVGPDHLVLTSERSVFIPAQEVRSLSLIEMSR